MPLPIKLLDAMHAMLSESGRIDSISQLSAYSGLDYAATHDGLEALRLRGALRQFYIERSGMGRPTRISYAKNQPETI